MSASVVREAAYLAEATHDASGEGMTPAEEFALMAAVVAGDHAFRFAASSHGGLAGICSDRSYGNSFHTRANLKRHILGSRTKGPLVSLCNAWGKHEVVVVRAAGAQ